MQRAFRGPTFGDCEPLRSKVTLQKAISLSKLFRDDALCRLNEFGSEERPLNSRSGLREAIDEWLGDLVRRAFAAAFSSLRRFTGILTFGFCSCAWANRSVVVGESSDLGLVWSLRRLELEDASAGFLGSGLKRWVWSMRKVAVRDGSAPFTLSELILWTVEDSIFSMEGRARFMMKNEL